MSFTLSDYYAEVGDKISTLSTIDKTRVYAAINKARRKVARQTDATILLKSFSFIAGTASYVYPTVSGCTMRFIMETYYYIGNLRFPTIGSLTELPVGFEPLQNLTGWPVGFSRSGGSIIYYPTPSMAYAAFMKGKIDPIDLGVSDPADTIIPEEFQDAVVYYAAGLTALIDGNLSLGQAMEELYKNELRSLPKQFM